MDDDQRERLQLRLVEAEREMREIERGYRDTNSLQRLSQLASTRDSIELALVQLDATDAQRQSSAAQLALADAERLRAKAAEDERLSRDDAAFWSRRFYTSLAVGNGVGFVTISSALIQSGKIGLAVVVGFAPLSYFAGGLAAAGAIPWLIWQQRARSPASRWLKPLRVATRLAATFSAGCFTLGLGSAAYEVWQFNPIAGKIAAAEALAAGRQAGLDAKATARPPGVQVPPPAIPAQPASRR